MWVVDWCWWRFLAFLGPPVERGGGLKGVSFPPRVRGGVWQEGLTGWTLVLILLVSQRVGVCVSQLDMDSSMATYSPNVSGEAHAD